jgi:hypothetical protein
MNSSLVSFFNNSVEAAKASLLGANKVKGPPDEAVGNFREELRKKSNPGLPTTKSKIDAGPSAGSKQCQSCGQHIVGEMSNSTAQRV